MMNNKSRIIAILLGLLVIFGAVYYFTKEGTPRSDNFTLSSEDKNVAWNIEPLYKKEEDVQKTKDIIAKVKKGEEGAQLTEAEKNIAIAQQYEFIGEAKESYAYLLKAIDANPTKSLAWGNMGHLLVKVKAYNSARTAFEKAVSVEPQFFQNHAALVTFLQDYFGDDTQAIENAFAFGLERTGKDINLLKEYATWLEEDGRFADSLREWNEVLKRGPDNEQAVKDKIKELESKI